MKRNALIIAIASAAFSTSVLAAEVGAESSGSADVTGSSAGISTDTEGFARLDADGDGKLSREEAQADPRLSSQWDSLDANADGNVDESEFSALEGHAPSAVTPEGKPNGLGAPGASQPDPGVGGGAGAGAGAGANPPGLSTDPGASERAPGQM